MPRLSVIIPVFNRADLLPATLASLIHQTRPPDEIIVVDDGSTDNSVEVARAFHSSVTVISQANAGPAAARNRGFEASKGNYILFFDSDDLATSEKIELQVKGLEESGADIAYGPFIKGLMNDQEFVPTTPIIQGRGLPDGDLAKILVTRWSVIPHTCLFRRSIIEKSGGFPEAFFGTEDQAFLLDCFLAEANVVHTPNALLLYREGNEGKITTSNINSRAREWAKFLMYARDRLIACKKPDPMGDWRYRQRLWQASQDLGDSSPDLRHSIREVLRPFPSWKFPILKTYQQYKGGLRSRLKGDRFDECFRTMQLTKKCLQDKILPTLRQGSSI